MWEIEQLQIQKKTVGENEFKILSLKGHTKKRFNINWIFEGVKHVSTPHYEHFTI